MWRRAAAILMAAAASVPAAGVEPDAAGAAPERDPAAATRSAGGDGPLAGLPPASRPSLPPSLAPRPAKSFVVPAVETAAVQLIVMGWNVWPGEAEWSNVSLESIGRNARSAWVIDDDEFYTNQLLHPYQGSFSFAAARSAGLGFWESLPYAFVASLAWEIAGETEQPSINDQITTSLGGAIVGELLHRLAEGLRGPRGGGWGEVPAAIVSPFSAVNRAVLGRPPPLPREPARWEVAAGAEASRVPGPEAGASPEWSGHGRLAATLVHGLPWHPGLALEGPFDHYRLEVGWAGGEDTRFTLLVRGLLAGRAHGAGDGWRGVSGLFTLLDLDTPGDFRVGTLGLGLGTAGGIALGRGLALEGTAIAAAIPMGAVGMRPPVVPDGRDYRFGPGAQAVAEVALTVRERAALRLDARGYGILGVDGVDGREAIGAVRARLLVRVAGEHGLGAEASLAGRRVDEAGAPVRTELGRTVQLFWFVSGFEAPRPGGGPRELASR
jgi:hypothetical protein